MAVNLNQKTKRVLPTGVVEDPSSLDAIIYSRQTSGFKVSETGSTLMPLNTGAAYTTNAVAGVTLPKQGCLLAIYNKDTSVHAVTLGLNAASVSAALALGVTDANGNVGVPIAPAQWVYLSCFTDQYVITDSAQLLVFMVADDSQINVLNG